MRKTFEFVKVGGVWFYWWPDYDGTPEELAMVGGADELLDSLDNKFVRLQMVDPAAAKITLSKIEEALDQRGISASLMFYVVLRWNQVLEEGLENYPEENYAMYGLPLFKATAVKYGWENPIGDDNGDEEFYNEQRYEGIFYT